MAHTLKESLEARVREAERRGLGRRAPVIDRTDMGPMVISGGKMFINYMSNDYIGLSQDMDWRRDVAECFAAWPPSGSASRLAGGFNSITKDAEQACAEYFGYDECLFLPSGYQGNLALVTGLLQPGQTALVDKRIHASTGHALMATRADIRPYAHADMDRLGRRLMELPEEAGEPCVFTESLFSMDGTVVRPEAFAELKKRRSFFLVADEAHAFGALGEGGRGIFSGERGVADAAIGTLGKALGLFGSFLLLPKGFTPLLEFLSSPIMHSTALPPAHSAEASEKAARTRREQGKAQKKRGVPAQAPLRARRPRGRGRTHRLRPSRERRARGSSRSQPLPGRDPCARGPLSHRALGQGASALRRHVAAHRGDARGNGSRRGRSP